MKRIFPTILLFTIILALWQILVVLFKVDTLFLPKPFDIFQVFFQKIISGDYWTHILTTTLRTFVGFFISTFIGLFLGVILGRFNSIYKLLEPLIDFLRSIPATALFPLFIFAAGIGDFSKILVVIYGCSLIVLVNTVYGIKAVNKSRINSMKLYGFGQTQIIRYVIIPEAMPSIYSGLKISMSLSIVLIIVTEMFIGTNRGLGYIIIQYQMVYKITEMYCAIFTAGLLGLFLNKLMMLIEKRALHWIGK